MVCERYTFAVGVQGAMLLGDAHLREIFLFWGCSGPYELLGCISGVNVWSKHNAFALLMVQELHCMCIRLLQ